MKKLKRMASLSAGKCLDIGFAQKPNPFLSNVYGIDVQEVEKPVNYEKVFVVNLNKESLPFKEKEFDTVLVGDVIEHVENPSHILREINRVLKEKGKLILSTPHANHWWTTIHNWFLHPFINDPDVGEHLNNWTIMDMKRLLKLNGFMVKKLWGTECYIPFISINIPVKYFPRWGWIIIYEAQRVGEPVKVIYTNQKGNPIQVKTD